MIKGLVVFDADKVGLVKADFNDPVVIPLSGGTPVDTYTWTITESQRGSYEVSIPNGNPLVEYSMYLSHKTDSSIVYDGILSSTSAQVWSDDLNAYGYNQFATNAGSVYARLAAIKADTEAIGGGLGSIGGTVGYILQRGTLRDRDYHLNIGGWQSCGMSYSAPMVPGQTINIYYMTDTEHPIQYLNHLGEVTLDPQFEADGGWGVVEVMGTLKITCAQNQTMVQFEEGDLSLSISSNNSASDGEVLVIHLPRFTGNDRCYGVLDDLSLVDCDQGGRMYVKAADTQVDTAAIADAVWDEQLAGHPTVGSAGDTLVHAGVGGDPWSAEIPNGYAAPQAGYVMVQLQAAYDQFSAMIAQLLSQTYNAGQITSPYAPLPAATLQLFTRANYSGVTTVGAKWATVLNTAGVKVFFTARAANAVTNAIDVECTITDAALGVIAIDLTPLQTAIKVGDYFWQLEARTYETTGTPPNEVTSVDEIWPMQEGKLYAKPTFKA